MEADHALLKVGMSVGSGEFSIEPGDSWFSENSFRVALSVRGSWEVEHVGLGVSSDYRIQSNSMPIYLRKSDASDKIRKFKGKAQTAVRFQSVY